MKFSIVIPTFNNVELLKKCLESVIRYTDLSDTEIIVIANGCTDGTESYLTIRESIIENLIVHWYNEPLGYTKASNAGISIARGEYIVLLNNDVELLEQEKGMWMYMLYAPFSYPYKYGTVGITGTTKISKPELLNTPFLIFFCVMICRQMITEIGMLDEIFSPGYGEDFDFCMTAEKFGWKTIQVPSEEPLATDGKQYVGTTFPIYHIGTQTFKDVIEYPEVIKRNTKIIEERWGFHGHLSYHNIDGSKDIEVPKRKPEENDFSQEISFTTLNIERAKTIDGFMLEPELLVLAKLASTAKVFIEIGSWHGRSSRAIADNLPESGILYCIDTWNGTDGENGAHDSAKGMSLDHAYYLFCYELFDLIKVGKVIPIRMKSENASVLFYKKNIKADVIFIDGDHSYEAVKNDINAWAAKRDDNGTTCGHDYVWDHPGVIKAVDEIYGKDKTTIFPNTSIWKYELTSKLKFGVAGFNKKREMVSVNKYEPTPEVKNTFDCEKMNEIWFDEPRKYDEGIKVTVGIPTKDRYEILANCLQSIIFQTYPPFEIIIVDDTENAPNLQEKFPLYDYLIKTLVENGIEFRVIFGQKSGPQFSHQIIQDNAKGDWIFRIDDDCVAEPDVLLKLVSVANVDNVGAVAPLVLLPFSQPFTSGRNMIKHIETPNVQWLKKVNYTDARQFESQDHLYSCFLYKKGLTNYELGLSKMGFREETLFSYKIMKAGYQLRINPHAVVHHFKSSTGGIRDYEKDRVMHEHDEGVFRSLMSLWDSGLHDTKIVVLNNGMGDHWAFKHILPEMIKTYGKIKIACCYTEVFNDIDKNNIEIISIAQAYELFWGQIELFNIYQRMFDWNWKQNTVEAFRKLYLSNQPN